jgi:hypothetical protein
MNPPPEPHTPICRCELTNLSSARKVCTRNSPNIHKYFATAIFPAHDSRIAHVWQQTVWL